MSKCGPPRKSFSVLKRLNYLDGWREIFEVRGAIPIRVSFFDDPSITTWKNVTWAQDLSDGDRVSVSVTQFFPKANISRKDIVMKHGARNQLTGKVKSIKLGDVMSLIKFDVTKPSEMASVITTESVNDLDLKVGDQVQLIVKAIHVLPVKM